MKQTTRNPETFFAKNKDLIIIGTTIVVIGTGLTWYYLKKKKKSSSDENTAYRFKFGNSTPSEQPLTRAKISTKSIYTNSGYPIKYGSKHPGVKILQHYLKIMHKQNLGKSGVNKDGIDGKFGKLTLNAAKKVLGKSVFTESDINGMQKAIKTIKR